MCLLTAPTLSQCHMDLCGHTLDIVIYSKSAFFGGFGDGSQCLSTTITLASGFYNSLY